MVLNYPKIDKTHKIVELLNDLLKINNDRVAGYQKALDQSTNIDVNLREEFRKIISDGSVYRSQLIQQISTLNGNAKTGTTIIGKIYCAWMDLKVAFACSTQKAIITSCLYNEQIALHAYNAALNMNLDMKAEICELIRDQEQALRTTHDQMRKYREARHIADYSLVYFN